MLTECYVGDNVSGPLGFVTGKVMQSDTLTCILIFTCRLPVMSAVWTSYFDQHIIDSGKPSCETGKPSCANYRPGRFLQRGLSLPAMRLFWQNDRRDNYILNQ